MTRPRGTRRLLSQSAKAVAALAWRESYDPAVRGALRLLEIRGRPETRGECLPGGAYEARPCPYLACRHHLGVEVSSVGALTETGAEACSLDLADEGERTLEEVAGMLAVSRERIRQIEAAALAKLERAGVQLGDAQ